MWVGRLRHWVAITVIMVLSLSVMVGSDSQVLMFTILVVIGQPRISFMTSFYVTSRVIKLYEGEINIRHGIR